MTKNTNHQQQDADRFKAAIQDACKDSALAQYYLLPYAWMERFLAHRPPGEIENKPFVESIQGDADSEDFSSDGTPTSDEYVVVSPDGEIDREARKQKWKKIESDRENMTLKESLSHECDYAIVGSTTWMFLRQKFNFDLAIQRDAIWLDGEDDTPDKYGVVVYPNGGGLLGGCVIDADEDSVFSFVPFEKDFKFNYGRNCAVSQNNCVPL